MIKLSSSLIAMIVRVSGLSLETVHERLENMTIQIVEAKDAMEKVKEQLQAYVLKSADVCYEDFEALEQVVTSKNGWLVESKQSSPKTSSYARRPRRRFLLFGMRLARIPAAYRSRYLFSYTKCCLDFGGLVVRCPQGKTPH